jgi:hypothetical protein
MVASTVQSPAPGKRFIINVIQRTESFQCVSDNGTGSAGILEPAANFCFAAGPAGEKTKTDLKRVFL